MKAKITPALNSQIVDEAKAACLEKYGNVYISKDQFDEQYFACIRKHGYKVLDFINHMKRYSGYLLED